MFDSIGWGEIVVLVVAGLFILGPERLPAAAAWLGKAIRQVREFATGARSQLKSELGPEFDELRKPLDELRGLRNLNPRSAVRRTLFEDDGAGPLSPGALDPSSMQPHHFAPGSSTPLAGSPLPESNGSAGLPPFLPRPLQQLAPDERPPIDPDAT